MFITIPPWDILVSKFGLDDDGDIGKRNFQWYAADEMLLPLDRTIEISDDPDEDGDYDISSRT